MGISGFNQEVTNMADNKSETWNLIVTAPVDDRNRLVIPKTVAEHAELKDGDLVTFVITQIHRKEAQTVNV